MWLRGSTILGLLALLGLCSAQTCETVDSQIVHCLDDGVLTIECPDKHWILVKSSTYYISESATCPPSGTDDCVAPGVVDEIKDECHQQRICDVTIPQRTNSVCAGSTHYIWLKYQCEPLHNTGGNARAVDMCNAADPFTGTLVHIDSHPSALFGTYIRQLDVCNCGVTIPAGNDIFFRVPFFLKQGSRDSQCDQKVVVWDEEDTFEFCSANTAQNVTCSDRERTFYVRYETASTSVQVIFLLQVFVPYMSEGLTLTCGIDPDDIGRTTPLLTTTPAIELITTETTGDTTPNDDDDNDVDDDDNGDDGGNDDEDGEDTTEGDSITDGLPDATEGDNTANELPDSGAVSDNDTEQTWKLPVIIGMVALSLLIMIIVILIICIRYRNDREKDVPDDTSERPSNYHFITEVYIEGDQKSKLVVDKKNGLMRM